MQSDGAIERYAIVGAVGATFYLDVDIFWKLFLTDAP
jgi:hypothetical protein